MKRIHSIITCFLLLLTVAAMAQDGPHGGADGRQRPAMARSLPAAVAAQTELSIILGCPTDTSITASILSAHTKEGYVEYGVVAGVYGQRTGQMTFPPNTPVAMVLDGLQPNMSYCYRLRMRAPGETPFAEGEVHGFHTQRAPGSTFTFAIQGDSHPERPRMHDPALYAQTLCAVAAEHPDFYLTIGDDFSVDTLRTVDADAVQTIYRRQRLFLGLVASSAPLFLTNGNHEQAAMCNLDNTPNNVAVWAQTARNTLFSQPAPNTFYTGDAQPVEHIGLLRDYFAWTWGDALFVIIDPYWHSARPVDNPFGGGEKTRDPWNSTLGEVQYQWLKQTLERSTAKYKFVFTHHVLGTGRGGIEEAGLYEWGGHERNGAYTFPANRPNWPLPIHQLLAYTGVTIFFQGHDHIFARQQLDGVVYQTLPEPADPNYALYNADAYGTGDIRPNSGYVRVTVSSEKVTVDYVRQYLPADETADRKSGEIAFSYTLPARTQ